MMNPPAQPLRVAFGTDHAGLVLREPVVACIQALGHSLLDFGATSDIPTDDYVDYAAEVARAVSEGRADRGVLLCGSGVGVTVAANKVAGVRACLCHDPFSAVQGVEDDAMNVLCLGGRVIGPSLARLLVQAFLAARFKDTVDRYVRRLNKVNELELPRQ